MDRKFTWTPTTSFLSIDSSLNPRERRPRVPEDPVAEADSVEEEAEASVATVAAEADSVEEEAEASVEAAVASEAIVVAEAEASEEEAEASEVVITSEEADKFNSFTYKYICT
jgi:hypothetical protein